MVYKVGDPVVTFKIRYSRTIDTQDTNRIVTRDYRRSPKVSMALEKEVYETLSKKVITRPRISTSRSTNSFCIKDTNVAESNYSTTEEECLAVVGALGNFHPYVPGASLTIYTDHTARKSHNIHRSR